MVFPSPTEVSTAHTPPLVVTTTLESVTPRPSPMPGAMVFPSPTEVFTAHTPPLAVTTTLESVTLRPGLMPGAITGWEDLSPPMEATTASWLTPTDISWLLQGGRICPHLWRLQPPAGSPLRTFLGYLRKSDRPKFILKELAYAISDYSTETLN